jgi:carboxyl-terminal processing protease
MGALELIRRNALFSDGLDWDAVDRQAQDAVAHACGYAGTYDLLGTVVKQAGGHHSRFIPPAAYRHALARVAAAGPALPAGGITGRVGYLALPRLPGGQKLAHRYIAAGAGLADQMAAARPQGWIVDLRDNSGGNMWPMLAAVAGLLEDGVLGHFVLPGGRSRRGRWTAGTSAWTATAQLTAAAASAAQMAARSRSSPLPGRQVQARRSPSPCIPSPACARSAHRRRV